MFGLSGEHLIILVAVLFIFGPAQLPKLGAVLGKTARNFKDGFKGVHEPRYRKLGERDAD